MDEQLTEAQEKELRAFAAEYFDCPTTEATNVALATIEQLRARVRELEGALVSVEIKSLDEPGLLINSIYRIAHAALNPDKEASDEPTERDFPHLFAKETTRG